MDKHSLNIAENKTGSESDRDIRVPLRKNNTTKQHSTITPSAIKKQKPLALKQRSDASPRILAKRMDLPQISGESPSLLKEKSKNADQLVKKTETISRSDYRGIQTSKSTSKEFGSDLLQYWQQNDQKFAELYIEHMPPKLAEWQILSYSESEKRSSIQRKTPTSRGHQKTKRRLITTKSGLVTTVTSTTNSSSLTPKKRTTATTPTTRTSTTRTTLTRTTTTPITTTTTPTTTTRSTTTTTITTTKTKTTTTTTAPTTTATTPTLTTTISSTKTTFLTKTTATATLAETTTVKTKIAKLTTTNATKNAVASRARTRTTRTRLPPSTTTAITTTTTATKKGTTAITTRVTTFGGTISEIVDAIQTIEEQKATEPGLPAALPTVNAGQIFTQGFTDKSSAVDENIVGEKTRKRKRKRSDYTLIIILWILAALLVVGVLGYVYYDHRKAKSARKRYRAEIEEEERIRRSRKARRKKRPRQMQAARINLSEFKEEGPLVMQAAYKGVVKHQLDNDKSTSLKTLKFDPSQNSLVWIGTEIERVEGQSQKTLVKSKECLSLIKSKERSAHKEIPSLKNQSSTGEASTKPKILEVNETGSKQLSLGKYGNSSAEKEGKQL